MESFTVSTALSRDQFVHVVLRRLYRKASTWAISLVSLGILGYWVYKICIHAVNWADETSYMFGAFGLVFLQLPGIHFFQARKSYTANPRAGKPIAYTFEETVIRVRGEDLDGYIPWGNISHLERLSPWVCLVTKDKALLAFPAKVFSEEQLVYIRERLDVQRQDAREAAL